MNNLEMFDKGQNVENVQHVLPVEIGMVINSGNSVVYAIRYGQEYEKNRIYYCKYNNAGLYKFWAEGLSYMEFCINYSEKSENVFRARLDEVIRKELDEIKEMKELPIVIGFSLNNSDDIMMHIQNYNPVGGIVKEKIWTIPFKLEMNSCGHTLTH